MDTTPTPPTPPVFVAPEPFTPPESDAPTHRERSPRLRTLTAGVAVAGVAATAAISFAVAGGGSGAGTTISGANPSAVDSTAGGTAQHGTTALPRAVQDGTGAPPFDADGDGGHRGPPGDGDFNDPARAFDDLDGSGAAAQPGTTTPGTLGSVQPPSAIAGPGHATTGGS